MYEKFPPAVCAGWLRSQEYKIGMIPRRFRLGRENLLDILTEIGNDLKDMYSVLDRLCEGPRSYFAALPTVNQTANAMKFYRNFNVEYDTACDVLDEYKMHAKAYRERFSNSQLLDRNPLNRHPTEIREDFFGKLETLRAAVGNMAESIEALPAVPGQRQTG